MEVASDTHLQTCCSAPSAATALHNLGRHVRSWFTRKFGEPTRAQRYAWPILHAGRNLLLSAPTGNGKTLAAFLPIIDALGGGDEFAGVRCLYVAPLKALTNDIGRNLHVCLEEMGAQGQRTRGPIRIGTRTGDTPARARQRLHTDPPDILFTTPESLAVLLSQPLAAELFANLRWVVVDEVHALLTNKRGADLTLSLERLEVLTPQSPQRIGLSATCSPLAEAGRFLVGPTRSCTLARADDHAPLHVNIEALESGPAFMARLVERLEPELLACRTMLIFAGTRGLTERLAWALRRRFPRWAAEIGVHHSSLDSSRRGLVEQRLRQGKLRAVVTSTSLELGIDIGTVDSVVLIHSPGSAIRLLQRVGRAGHQPGRPRRGSVFVSSPAGLLEATVLGVSSHAGQLEAQTVPDHPLDVLCQQLVGMASVRTWSAAEALELIRRAYPYRKLSDQDFDDCLDYLSGVRRCGEPWLPARLRWVGPEFVVRDARTAHLLRRNLGTIISEDSRSVQLLGTDGNSLPLGKLDEPFADRLQPGSCFLLDSRSVRVRNADGVAIMVEELAGRPAVPRWGSEGSPLSRELAGRLYLLRIQAAEALRAGPHALSELLREDYGLDASAAEMLLAYFRMQESVSEIPDSAAVLIEAVHAFAAIEYYFHTPLNRAANDAIARVVAFRLARDLEIATTSLVADLGFMLHIESSRDLGASALRQLLAAECFDSDLTAAIVGSVALRERFRRVAQTGLMVLRNPAGRKRKVGGPNWEERRLFDRVRAVEPDFVLLRQALRELSEESCDVAGAGQFLAALPRLALRVRWLAEASPFAQGWTQPALGPVEMVGTQGEALRRLQAALVHSGDAIASPYRLAIDA